MNLEEDLQRVLKGEIIPEERLYEYCERLKEILFFENNIVKVRSPVVVCGDIHG